MLVFGNSGGLGSSSTATVGCVIQRNALAVRGVHTELRPPLFVHAFRSSWTISCYCRCIPRTLQEPLGIIPANTLPPATHNIALCPASTFQARGKGEEQLFRSVTRVYLSRCWIDALSTRPDRKIIHTHVLATSPRLILTPAARTGTYKW